MFVEKVYFQQVYKQIFLKRLVRGSFNKSLENPRDGARSIEIGWNFQVSVIPSVSRSYAELDWLNLWKIQCF